MLNTQLKIQPKHPNFKTPICSVNGKRYKYGFNGQEKDNEIAGEGNIYTAEYWEYDSRLGRRWNLDFCYKLYCSNYSVLHNKPLTNIDPNGDDDYYNEHGKYLYTDTKTSNDIRIISQDNFDRINLLHNLVLNDKTTSNLEVISKLDEFSKVAIIDIPSEQLDNLWNESFIMTEEGRRKVEQNIMIVLDLSNEEKPKIVAIQTPDENNGPDYSRFKYHESPSGLKTYNGSPLLGSAHTHPNAGLGWAVNVAGNSGCENLSCDGGVALNVNFPIFNLYGPSLHPDSPTPKIDMHHPIDKNKSIENLGSYNDGNKLGRTALEVNGGTPKNKNEHQVKPPFAVGN
ncbi:MAG: hypothetical protein Q8K70_10030 [Bacteroidota bacterium]|nr:hypothetical protein [Bacteroidota bacterium]